MPVTSLWPSSGVPLAVILALGGVEWWVAAAVALASATLAFFARDVERAGGWHSWRTEGLVLAEERQVLRARNQRRRLGNQKRRLEARLERRRIRRRARRRVGMPLS